MQISFIENCRKLIILIYFAGQGLSNEEMSKVCIYLIIGFNNFAMWKFGYHSLVQIENEK